MKLAPTLWCARGDSNPYPSPEWNLNPSCIPISPRALILSKAQTAEPPKGYSPSIVPKRKVCQDCPHGLDMLYHTGARFKCQCLPLFKVPISVRNFLPIRFCVPPGENSLVIPAPCGGGNTKKNWDFFKQPLVCCTILQITTGLPKWRLTTLQVRDRIVAIQVNRG